MTNRIGWCDNDLTGNQVKNNGGYILSRCPEHPHALPNGYVLLHRLILENHLKRHLEPEEIVHHINGIRDDNRVENLEIHSNSEHMSLHTAKLSKEELREKAKSLNEYSQKIKIPRRIVECACGCGQTFETPTRHYARPKKYISGHNQRGKHWIRGKDDGKN